MNARTGTREQGVAAAGAGPEMSRRRVRETLRRARQTRELTQEQAAAALDWSLSKLVRIEAGRTGISVTDAQALLDLYRVPADQAGQVTALARAARQRPWFAGAAKA